MEVLFKELQERKVRVMLNDNERFKVENSEINICGMDFSSSERSDLAKTVEGINTDNYTIMLSHKPDIVIKYQDMPCDLILCGHTHGGQIRLPLIGALIAPDQGMLPKYNKGLYKISDKTFLYVDSGTGTTRLPVRFFNRSQVSLINIEK
jgi:predicted MPP superfamily phosphohydrolase